MTKTDEGTDLAAVKRLSVVTRRIINGLWETHRWHGFSSNIQALSVSVRDSADVDQDKATSIALAFVEGVTEFDVVPAILQGTIMHILAKRSERMDGSGGHSLDDTGARMLWVALVERMDRLAVAEKDYAEALEAVADVAETVDLGGLGVHE